MWEALVCGIIYEDDETTHCRPLLYSCHIRPASDRYGSDSDIAFWPPRLSVSNPGALMLHFAICQVDIIISPS